MDGRPTEAGEQWIDGQTYRTMLRWACCAVLCCANESGFFLVTTREQTPGADGKVCLFGLTCDYLARSGDVGTAFCNELRDDFLCWQEVQRKKWRVAACWACNNATVQQEDTPLAANSNFPGASPARARNRQPFKSLSCAFSTALTAAATVCYVCVNSRIQSASRSFRALWIQAQICHCLSTCRIVFAMPFILCSTLLSTVLCSTVLYLLINAQSLSNPLRTCVPDALTFPSWPLDLSQIRGGSPADIPDFPISTK